MSIIDLLERERALRARAEHLRSEARRADQDADQLRDEAWRLQHDQFTHSMELAS
jgi:hypothetical protein